MRMNFLLMAMLAFSGTLHAAEDLKIKFDEKGLASIVHNGVVLVNPADGRFVVQGVAFTDPHEKSGVRRMWQPKPTKSAFDAAPRPFVKSTTGARWRASSQRMKTGWTCGSP